MPSPSPNVFWIGGPWNGRLAILPRPRGGDWLEDTVRFWKTLPMSMVVSALTDEEITELELRKEADYCRENEIEYVSTPSRTGAFQNQ